MLSFKTLAASRRPLVFAHRGANSLAPENTISAFSAARDRGADGLELDVKLSADGQVVVMHDQTVGRTTDGHGRLRNFRLADLRRLDAGSIQRLVSWGVNGIITDEPEIARNALANVRSLSGNK